MTQIETLLSDLDKLGEAVKRLGENGIILGYFAPGPLRLQERFTARIELEGTPGVHGSGASYSEAVRNAFAQREEDARRLEIEAQIRAEVERRTERKEAA